MKKDPYIKLIEFALSQDGGVFTAQQAIDASGLKVGDLAKAHESLFIKPEQFPAIPIGPSGSEFDRIGLPEGKLEEKRRWILSPDAIFGYISYRQHQDANRNAQVTHFMVGLSIIITFCSLLVSVASLQAN